MLKAIVVGTLTTASLVAAGAASAQAPQPDTHAAQYRGTGEQERTYAFPGTGEAIAYHLYVPKRWTAGASLPLVVVTHGAFQSAAAPFQRPMTDPTLAATAEKRGYIVAAVTGYHANATGVGGWNVPYKMIAAPRPAAPPAAPAAASGAQSVAPAAPAAQREPPTATELERAELDVLYVADLVAKEYNVDSKHVYLMGNSSGGSAVWTYGAKYPQRWAAIAPSAAPLEDATFPYDGLKNVPVLVIHGDKDTTMSFDGSKVMVDHAKAKGLDVTWLPVVGGMHTDAWAQPAIIGQIFDFFDAHAKK